MCVHNEVNGTCPTAFYHLSTCLFFVTISAEMSSVSIAIMHILSSTSPSELIVLTAKDLKSHWNQGKQKKKTT